MSAPHCLNLNDDRTMGAFWEQQFCQLAFRFGCTLTPHQIGRSDRTAVAWHQPNGTNPGKLILPDITIWSAPAQHHEIKHKNPTVSGEFGLEEYRFNSLWQFYEITQQPVYYTIHNHDLAGGRYATENKLEHWVSANVRVLKAATKRKKAGASWINGAKRETTIFYWDAGIFFPLAGVLRRHQFRGPSLPVTTSPPDRISAPYR